MRVMIGQLELQGLAEQLATRRPHRRARQQFVAPFFGPIEPQAIGGNLRRTPCAIGLFIGADDLLLLERRGVVGASQLPEPSLLGDRVHQHQAVLRDRRRCGEIGPTRFPHQLGCLKIVIGRQASRHINAAQSAAIAHKPDRPAVCFDKRVEVFLGRVERLQFERPADGGFKVWRIEKWSLGQHVAFIEWRLHVKLDLIHDGHLDLARGPSPARLLDRNDHAPARHLNLQRSLRERLSLTAHNIGPHKHEATGRSRIDLQRHEQIVASRWYVARIDDRRSGRLRGRHRLAIGSAILDHRRGR